MNRTAQAEQFATPVPASETSVTVSMQPEQVVSATGAPAGATVGAVRGATQYAEALKDLADR